MPTEPDHAVPKGWLLAVLLPAVACCTLPLLIAAGGAGALGAVFTNGWVIAGAAIILATVVVVRPLSTGAGEHDCCPSGPLAPGSPIHAAKGELTQDAT